MTESEIGAAARRQSQAILGNIFWPPKKEKLDQIRRKPQMHVINMTSGAGESSTGLIEMLNAKSTIISFDFDPVNISTTSLRAARISSGCRHILNNTRFENSDLCDQADWIVGMCILDNLDRVNAMIRKAFHCLKPGGTVIMDFVDLSKCQGFPGSFALDRYADYLRLYQETLGLELSVSGIRSLFDAGWFAYVSVESTIPRFLNPTQRQLPSLTLEYLTPFIIDQKLSSEIEIDAVISELRHLTGRPEVLISGPTAFQVTALKVTQSEFNHS